MYDLDAEICFYNNNNIIIMIIIIITLFKSQFILAELSMSALLIGKTVNQINISNKSNQTKPNVGF